MLKDVFLAALILLIGYSQADDCVRGPSYWCQSIKNANECNAFKHCLQTVWTTHSRYLNKIQLKLSNNPNGCSNCVQCLETEQSDCHITQLFKQEIELLKKSNIPNESICKLLGVCADENLENVNNEKIYDSNQVEYKFDSRFKCGLHPRNWCDNLETAKRCDSIELCQSKWSNLKYKLKNSDPWTYRELNTEKTCGFCMFIFTKLQQAIQQNATEINVKDYLEGACTLLPAQNLTESCIQQVDKYLPEIYNMLRNNLDAGIICRVLKQCSDANLEEIKPEKSLLDSISLTILNEKDIVIKTPLQNDKSETNTEYLFGGKGENFVDELKRSSGVACELCTIVMNAAKYMIKNKNDNAKVLNFIEKQLCARLGSLNSTCVEYVEQEGAEIINLLINSVDPSIVCHAMGLCMKVQISDKTEKFYDLNVRNPLNCTLCKVVFNQVKKMLTEQKSQARILEYVDSNLCQKVGKSKELCKTLIDAYGPLFLEIVARDVKPDQLCVMIGMCATESDEITVKPNEVQGSGQYCVVCEFFITVLERYINENSTIPEIEKAMSYVCEHAFPASIRSECSSFVTTYGDIILSLLTNQVPPSKVCTVMGLCNKTESAAPQFMDEINFFRQKSNLVAQQQKSALERVQESRGQSIRCTVCQYSIQYISNQYQVDRTEKAIEFTIQNVCKLTPKSYRSHCDSMVDRHGVRLINFMEKYSEPAKVCGSIRMCPVEQEVKVEMINIIPAKPVENKAQNNDVSLFDESKNANNKTLVCSLCLYVSEVVDEKLKQNKTEEQITKELLLVCNLFPSQIKDQCTAFINEYGPYVIQLIAADLSPETTCAALKLCEKTVEKDSLRHVLLNRFQ